MDKFELREKYRSEWENTVINKINQGWLRSEAQNWADESLMDKYESDEEED